MRTFFVTGLGRSGTQWLAALLKEAPNAFVQHEWWYLRYEALLPMHTQDPKHFDRDYVTLRMNETHEAMRLSDKPIYGEVNSKARYFLPDLVEEFDSVVTLQLVRDGRDVVRSYHARQTFTGYDLHKPLMPQSGRAKEQWPNFDRFQKLCWFWAWSTSMVDHHADGFVRFEDLLGESGWSILQERVLRPVGISLDKEVWERMRHVVVDRSSCSYTLPRWTVWDNWHKEWFRSMCSHMMKRFRYET